MAAQVWAIELSTQIRVIASGGPGYPQDKLVLVDKSGTTVDWLYLNNSKTAPTTGLTQGAVAFAKPPIGSYVVQFVAVPPAPYAQQVVADGASAYWRLGETSGTTAVDVIGGKNGTISGGVTLGQVGALADGDKAMLFGATGKIRTAWAFTPPAAYTMEAWIKFGGTGQVPIVNNYNTGVAGQVYFGLTNAAVMFLYAQGGTPAAVTGTVSLNDNSWHHVVWVIGSGQTRCYVDGVLRDTLAQTQAAGVAGTIDLGFCAATNEFWQWFLDDVAIYPTTLTVAQIIAHYAARTLPSTQLPSTVLASDIIDIKPEPLAVLEFELLGKGNGWTIIRDWFLSPGLSFHRGLPGIEITDLVADIGTLHWTLDNSDKNSKKLVGLYSPDHANKLYGFYLNIGVRYRIGSLVRFTGILTAIDPTPGRFGSRIVQCEASDWMSTADRLRISNLPVLVNKRGDEVFQTLIDSIPDSAKPDAVQKDISPDTYPYTLDRTRDEETVLRDEIYRLSTSGISRCYILGDGTLVYESRARRVNTTVNVDTFSDANSFSASQDRSTIVNRAQTTIHPRLPGVTDVVMYSLPQPMPIVAGLAITILGGWVDPANPSIRVGAVSLVSLVRGTDYVANTAQDGSGTDLTPGLTVVAGLSGNATSFTITATQNGFLTKLQQRGKPLYDYGAATLVWDDPLSITQFGLTGVSLDMPYTASAALALEVAQFTVFNGAFPITSVSSFTRIIDANNSVERSRSINRQISDRIGIVDAVTGIAKSFFINAIDESITENVLTTSWLLAPADSTAYWELEIDGKTELDLTTRLAFGEILGHTDIAHQDIHGDILHGDIIHADSHTDNIHQDIAHGDGQGVHGDNAHSDIAHQDTAHSDGPHTDAGGYEPHEDTSHSDSHSDVSHGDAAHQDAHSDHGDYVAGQSFTDHFDCVDQVSFYHGDSGHPTLFYHHMDCAGAGQHGDFSYINQIAQSEYHNDTTNHSDVAHTDIHSDSHNDSHDDRAHTDQHGDVAHIDRTHVDYHDDIAHIDITHQDIAHTDIAHGDAVGHSDTVHSDVAHGDVAHQDVIHSDIPHSDFHQDYHGDTN